eukprot:gene11371-2071_t
MPMLPGGVPGSCQLHRVRVAGAGHANVCAHKVRRGTPSSRRGGVAGLARVQGWQPGDPVAYTVEGRPGRGPNAGAGAGAGAGAACDGAGDCGDGDGPAVVDLARRYWCDGYAVWRNAVPVEAARRAVEAAAELAEQELARARAVLESPLADNMPRAVAAVACRVDKDADGHAFGTAVLSVPVPREASGPTAGHPASARKIDGAFSKSRAFRTIALAEPLQDALKVLLGGQHPRLLSDEVYAEVFLKPALCGSAKHLHQDNHYFGLEPADEVVTAWVALEDADEANGCMRYIPGTHRGPLLPHSAPSTEEPHNLAVEGLLSPQAVCVPCTTGSVIFHHGNTVHGSAANLSTHSRQEALSLVNSANVFTPRIRIKKLVEEIMSIG